MMVFNFYVDQNIAQIYSRNWELNNVHDMTYAVTNDNIIQYHLVDKHSFFLDVLSFLLYSGKNKGI